MSKREQKPAWVKHFNLDEATWVTLCAQALQMKTSPLDLALDNGTFSESIFLSWDREVSGLPTLKYDFFNSDAPLSLLSNFEYEKCRQKGCMPVGEWEGHTFWAKISSDETGFESEYPGSIWLLAPWSGMKKWFSNWEGSNNSSERTTISLPPVPAPVPTPELEEQSSSDRTQIMSLDFSALQFEVPGEAKPMESLPEIPSSANFSPEMTPPALPQIPTETPEVLDEPSLKLQNSAGNTVPNFIMPTAIDQKPNMSAPIPKLAVTRRDFSSSEIELDEDAEELESSLQLAQNQETLVGIFMNSWELKFEQLMIFLYNKKNLTIRWHNKKWKGKFKVDDKVNFDSPSIFKIVMETNHPYHGHLVQSPANDVFFKTVNDGKYPDHVTLVPIVNGEKIVGMILGACSREKSTDLHLNRLVDDANAFSKGLLRVTAVEEKAA